MSVDLLQALDDERLFKPLFQPAASWASWRVFHKALFGLAMSDTERKIFERHTGRTTPPTQPVREAWLTVGRRGGKSRSAALVAVYLAAFRDYSKHLAPGERATIALIAADRRQARTLFRYCRGLLEGVPMLRSLIERITSEQIDLTNRVTIEVHTCSFRSTRGYTLAAVICDEVAYWSAEDSATPDAEVIAALRPGLATIPGALLVAISSPYARRGELWSNFKRHHGQDGDPVLSWQSDTRSMNPSVPAHVIDEALAEDPARAGAEYLAQFRTDVESFLPRELIDAAVEPGVVERPYERRHVYRGFLDPSGGAADSFTLAIAHAERFGPYKVAVLDCLRETVPPFDPDEVVNEYAEALDRYALASVVSDRYGGAWVQQSFRRARVTLKHSELAKSQIYSECVPGFTAGRVRLLDQPRLLAQLANLERRTARGGKDSIDHPPGGRDDLANSCCGALELILRKPTEPHPIIRW